MTSSLGRILVMVVAAGGCAGPATPAAPAAPPETPAPTVTDAAPAVILELPGDDLVAGWRRAEPATTFTASQLYDHIDGGAELFLELGFARVTVQPYRNGDRELTVDAYRMSDPLAARAIFLASQGDGQRSAELAADHRAGRYQLAFHKDRYYVLVSNPAGAKELAPAMIAMAASMAAQLPDSPVSAIIGLLPEGRVRDSLRLLRGPTGLNALYTLGEGNVLGLGGDTVAVAASYRGAGDVPLLRLAVEYPSPAAADAAFANLSAHLDPYLEVTTRAKARLVFEDYAGRWGEVATTDRRIDITLNLPAPP